MNTLLKYAMTLSLLAVPSSTYAQAEKTSSAAGSKPNILMIISDDTGYWDLGPYFGGKARGMDTPNLDQMAHEGMIFTDFYAQASCTPGRAAMQTGRIPNRSGMTTVAFQGQGGGLPAAEWTLASLLKEAGYNTYFAGKWHLGESDYALPTAHGYDKMENTFLYHLNAYTYMMKEFNPQMSDEQRAFFRKITTGVLEGEAGGKTKEVLTAANMTVEDLANLDAVTQQKSIAELERLAKQDKPFFMSINWAANHQPNLPSKDFVGKSAIKNKYGDKVVELDFHTGKLLDKVKELGIEENTLVFYTVDNGAWQDVHPDAGMTPFRGTKGTDRDGGWRVPAIFKWKGKIEPGSKSSEIVGGLDLMATFAALAGVDLPKEDREGKPMIFDSHDMSPVLFGEGKSSRNHWLYFTEQELSPGAIRMGPWKAVFNMRGDNGAKAGSDAPAPELGWRGAEKYVATVPQVYNLWEDPQERYDIFMTTGRENTWTVPFFMGELEKVVKSYEKYPPRKLQSESYTGPITINRFRLMEKVKPILKKQGIEVNQ
ncbi:arylsulfatase [Polycladidibacter hongkongensis]|uniref:arylsulfatase n=1 Tax=Polycladidibacter hongkongensis TaxID=1647556 RepID=UPI000835B0F5|nr:arylsulfatase [Pseudovibrio hongkongensis]